MGHGGYTFSSDAQGGEVFQQFIHSHNTAYTEFGVPAVSSVETLREIIPADELFPIHKTEAWVAHHGFDAWGSDAWLQLPTWNLWNSWWKNLHGCNVRDIRLHLRKCANSGRIAE